MKDKKVHIRYNKKKKELRIHNIHARMFLKKNGLLLNSFVRLLKRSNYWKYSPFSTDFLS